MEAGKVVEAEGSTIDEAIANALAALGAGREQVEIEILADGARGILGLGKRKARVRARLRPPLAVGLSHAGNKTAPEVPAMPVEGAWQGGPSGESGSALAFADAAARAREILEEVVHRMGFAVEIRSNGQREDGAVELSIAGEDAGQLIGRHGQTLDALEYLVGRIAARGGECKQRVVLECGSYRESRRKALEQMALKLGERAKRRGRPVTMEAMSPRDRRTVHMALRSCVGVTTRSVGDGYYRKLRIIPAGGRRGGH